MQNKILVITYWSFNDALVQTYTLPYVLQIKDSLGEGSNIWLLTMEQSHLKMGKETWRQCREQYARKGIHLIKINYKPFGIKAIGMITRLIFRLWILVVFKRISMLHCWGAPAGVPGYILSVLTHKKLIIDSFEPHAESMVENGTWKANGFAFRFLFKMERRMAKRAFALIGTTQSMRQYSIDKYKIEPKNFYAKPACVNLDVFNPERFHRDQLRRARGLENKVVCVYAGKIGGIYLEQEVFDFFAVCSKHWGDKFVALLLTNAEEKRVHELANIAGCPIACIQISFVPHSQIPEIMSMADFALNPVKPVPSKRYCTSIKDGEYWAMGLPVVITKDISDDSCMIDQFHLGYVLKTLTVDSYRNAVIEIEHLLNPALIVQTTQKIRMLAIDYRGFDISCKIYNTIYGTNIKTCVYE